MKILGIVGSKRKKGNTRYLVEEALTGAEQQGFSTELIFLGDYSISGCRGCEGCEETGECIINDDMQQIYPLLNEAEGVILGSPTYFYNVSSDVKAFIDRCYCFVHFSPEDRSCMISLNEVLGIKYCAVIAVCEQLKEEDMGPINEIMEKSMESLGYRVVDSIKSIEHFEPGSVLKDKKSLEASRAAGERLARTLTLKKDVENRVDRHDG